MRLKNNCRNRRNLIQVKSKFSIWSNMSKGDIIKVEVEVKSEKGASNGMYVPTVYLYKLY